MTPSLIRVGAGCFVFPFVEFWVPGAGVPSGEDRIEERSDGGEAFEDGSLWEAGDLRCLYRVAGFPRW